MNEYWLVIMCRWGDNEKHSYPCGAFKTFDEALARARKEECYRGNKYSAWLYKYNKDNYIEKVYKNITDELGRGDNV